MKMSGSAGLFNLVGSPKVGGMGDGKHTQKIRPPYSTGKYVCTTRCSNSHNTIYELFV